MEKVRNGEIPMGKVQKWKNSDGEIRMENGESPMEKVRSGRKKVLCGDFPMEKVRIPEKV